MPTEYLTAKCAVCGRPIRKGAKSNWHYAVKSVRDRKSKPHKCRPLTGTVKLHRK